MSTYWNGNCSEANGKYKLDVGEFLIMLYEIKWSAKGTPYYPTH
ncbi:hypothetical protein [Polaribacter sp. 20A6]|nr:hypothetical protein [Polaribacter sp. 20A6]